VTRTVNGGKGKTDTPNPPYKKKTIIGNRKKNSKEKGIHE